MRLISRLETAAIDFPFEKKARGESKDRGKVVETASSSGIDKWKPENIGLGRGISRASISGTAFPSFVNATYAWEDPCILAKVPSTLFSSVSRPLPRGYLSSPIEGWTPSIHVQFKKIFYKIVRALHSFLSFHLDFKIPRKNQEKEKKSKQNSYIIIRSFLKSRISKKLFSKEFLRVLSGEKKEKIESLVRQRKRRAVSTLFLLLLFFFPLSLLPSTIYPFSNVCPRHERKCRRTGSTIFRRLLVPDFRPVFLHVAGCVGRAFISRCISRITIPDIHEFVPLIRVTSARRSSYPLVRRCLRPANSRFEWTRFRKKEKASKMSKAREKYFDRAVYLI